MRLGAEGQSQRSGRACTGQLMRRARAGVHNLCADRRPPKDLCADIPTHGTLNILTALRGGVFKEATTLTGSL